MWTHDGAITLAGYGDDGDFRADLKDHFGEDKDSQAELGGRLQADMGCDRFEVTLVTFIC